MHLAIFSVLLVAIASHSAHGQGPRICDPNVPFDYLMLALQWPPGICYSNLKQECVDFGNKFVIHGNWPTYANGSWPEFCCFQRYFDVRKVSEVEPVLKNKWGTLFEGGSDEGFWRHEWQKHGTCAAISPQLKGQRNYFTTSLEMFDKSNVQELLKKAGIVPQSMDSGKSFYALKDLHKAIESKFERKVRFECRRLPRRIAEDPILSGMYLCYDPVTLAPVDCAQPDDSDCGNRNIMFLSKNSASGQSTSFLVVGSSLLLFIICTKIFF